MAADIAVPVSNDTQLIATPIASSYSPITLACWNGIGHSRKYATVISCASAIACVAPVIIATPAAAPIRVDLIFIIDRLRVGRTHNRRELFRGQGCPCLVIYEVNMILTLNGSPHHFTIVQKVAVP